MAIHLRYDDQNKSHSDAADDADVEAVVVGNTPNYNAGFATRKAMLDNHGRFSCAIPLLHIFGFCRDVRKVIFGASHAVVFARRQTDDYVLWHGDGVNHGAVKLSMLALWMPILASLSGVFDNLRVFLTATVENVDRITATLDDLPALKDTVDKVKIPHAKGQIHNLVYTVQYGKMDWIRG